MKVNNFNPSAMGVREANRQDQGSVALANGNAKNVNGEQRTDIGVDDVINDEMLENSIKDANKSLGQYNRTIERSIHETTHAIMYVLKDTLTGEVIKEFPPRKIQDMIAKMWEIAGLLVDERR